MFSGEFWEIFKTMFYVAHLWKTASVGNSLLFNNYKKLSSPGKLIVFLFQTSIGGGFLGIELVECS